MGSDAISGVQQVTGHVLRNSSNTQAHPESQGPGRREATAVVGRGNDQVALASGASRQALDTLQRIGTITDAINATASGIRDTRDGLQASADIIARMEGELTRIIKNFPPFSIDDGNRKKILMGYSALRKEIEELTVPPPPPPIYEKVQGMWDKLVSQGSDKIDTPALQQDASDGTVQAAARQLTVTGDTISRLISTVENSL